MMDKSNLSLQIENLSLNLSNLSTSNTSLKDGKTRKKLSQKNGGSGHKHRRNQHSSNANHQNENKKPEHHNHQSPFNGDRFIPDRLAMNFELSNYLMNNDDTNNTNNSSTAATTVNNSNKMNELIGTNDLANHRILSYRNVAPKPYEGYINDTKAAYSCTKSASKSTKSNRYISKQPERILDAPDVLNDYYLQLIDWNCQNILAVALNNEVYLWNATNGNIIHLLELPEPDYVSSVSWVNNSDSHLAVGLSTGVTQLWDINKSRCLRNLNNSASRISCMSWNSYVLSNGTKDGTIVNHDVRVASSQIGILRGHSLEICGLKWSPDGRNLASGGNDNTVNIWSNRFLNNNTQSNEEITEPLIRLTHHQAAVKALAWCPWRNNCLASGGGTNDRMIRIWNTFDGHCMYSVDTRSQVSAILWSEQYRELISSHGYANNELIIWKYPQFTRIIDLLGHSGRILCMCMNADGSTVVSLGADETLRFWDCFESDPAERRKKKKDSAASSTNSKICRKNLTDFNGKENAGFHIR